MKDHIISGTTLPLDAFKNSLNELYDLASEISKLPDSFDSNNSL